MRLVTHPEFVGFENASLERHELVDGQIVAMAGATPRHVAVATGTLHALEAALGPGGCHAHGSDLRVYVPSTGLSAYPDVTVICGTWQLDAEDPSAVINPTVLVEVLSPSTERYDRVIKGPQYREIPTLTDLLLISPDRVEVEHWRRPPGASWEVRRVSGGAVELASGTRIAVGTFYARAADLPSTG